MSNAGQRLPSFQPELLERRSHHLEERESLQEEKAWGTRGFVPDVLYSLSTAANKGPPT